MGCAVGSGGIQAGPDNDPAEKVLSGQTSHSAACRGPWLGPGAQEASGEKGT